MVINFPHSAPEGYYYSFEKFNSNLISIWLNFEQKFSYNSGESVQTIWGFYDTKKKKYYAPINSKKSGSEVDIKQTTPYSAMQIKTTPLERCFM